MDNKQMWDAWKEMCATVDFATLSNGIIITTADGQTFGGPAEIATNEAFNHHRAITRAEADKEERDG